MSINKEALGIIRRSTTGINRKSAFMLARHWQREKDYVRIYRRDKVKL